MNRVITRMVVVCVVLVAGRSIGNAAPAAKDVGKPKAAPAKKEVSKPKTPAPSSAAVPAMPAKPSATWLTYHLAHPGPGGTYPADPNCAVYWKGRYHLHYIYQPGRYNHCFAHVSSADMLHWTWQPTTLTTASTRHGMFSGTAFLTKEGKPAVIYHGLGTGKNQISIALDDNLEQWTKPYPLEAKTKSGEVSPIKYWDPDCWLSGDTYYAISGGKPAMLMKSSDLKTWEDLGPLLHADMPATLGVKKDEDISCPNMFKLGDKWMLLCISHGMGCRYYLGTLKDEKYLPDFHGRMNWKGQDFFAPESLLTPDGRRVMWAWCFFAKPVGLQGGIQSLPRELSLPEDGVLRIRPLRELETLRYEEKAEADVTLKADSNYALKEIAGDALELKVVIKPGAAKQFGVQVYGDKDGKGFPITVDPGSKTLSLGATKVPFELKAGEDLSLRIFLDKSLVEVFANERQAAVALAPRGPDGVGIKLFSNGGDAVAKEVKSWKMKSAYASSDQ